MRRDCGTFEGSGAVMLRVRKELNQFVTHSIHVMLNFGVGFTHPNLNSQPCFLVHFNKLEHWIPIFGHIHESVKC